ncbi:disks large homolog 1-like [Melopsittacus undulatus]|uniref:disks large homolog 1-like n=1 Tax=Melopsittacus undulatus TaxID=13146 RepID=UPI00124368FE|nr:disks large homolog 1-like [Melopsittacus undulatus]XP_033928842.1 disks large homolog 1-like [Melopsittacus undulatus]XP_033928848.1 disks large homolog 1-like [Melopsittacus undulatus]XP_033928849.1 disks large homolog 1-like [Melopsittacus undulatus]
MPVKKKDTDRALVLLEEYCKKLRKPEEQQLKKAIRKVMGIFKSSLFQALLGSSTLLFFTVQLQSSACTAGPLLTTPVCCITRTVALFNIQENSILLL